MPPNIEESKPSKISLGACLQALRRYPSIPVLLVLGIIGFFLGQLLFDRVFASASINLKYSKPDILSMASKKLKYWGYEKPDTKSEVEFGFDSAPKNFLEQSFGQEEANRLMSLVPLWYWQCTYSKDDGPTTTIQLTPDGQLKHFERTFPNDFRLPSLDRKAAQAVAIALAQKESGLDLTKWNLLTSSDTALQDRIDHSFEWEDPSADYRGATKRVSINISGDRVSEFTHYVHVPEAWLQQYNISRSYNTLFATIATFLYYLFILGAIAVFIRGIIKKSFSYKTALIFGGIFALAEFAKSFNTMAASHFTNPITQILFMIFAAATACAIGLGIAILFAAAQPLYREICPDRWPLKDWFTWKMLRSPELMQGIIVGFAVCFVGQGYQMLYYLLGERAGYWCPLSAGGFETLSRPYPFLDAFHVGISASFMEEILFRVIGLALLQKLCRGNFWLANFLQAAIWGFAHSNYPQQPAFARGLELTIEGVFDGWLLRRFGLIPNLVSHYLFDVICTIAVLKSAPPSVAWTGMIPVLIPAVVLLISVAVSAWKGLVYPPKMTGEELRKTAEFFRLKGTMGRPIAFIYNALSTRARVILSVLAVICLAIPFLPAFDTFRPIGTDIKPLTVKRQHVFGEAIKYLRDINIVVDGFVPTTWIGAISADETTRKTATFVRSQADYQTTKQLIEQLNPTTWYISFQKPESPVHYIVQFDQSGRFDRVLLVSAEDAPGANLSEAEAQTIAEKFLAKYHPDWLPVKLLDSKTYKKKNRTDHSFSFSVPKLKAGKAEPVAEVSTVGDLVSALSMSVRIPDSWKLLHSDKELIATSAGSWVMGNFLLIALMVWLLFSLWREGHVRWKLALAAGTALAGLDLLRTLNASTTFYLGYDGNSPVSNFVTSEILSSAQTCLNSGIRGACGSLLVFAIIHKYFKRTYLESAFSLAFAPRDRAERPEQRRFWIDAILIAVFVVAADQAFRAATGAFQAWAGDQPPFVPDWHYYLTSTNSVSAAFRIVAAGLLTMITYFSQATIFPALTHKFLRGKAWIAGVVAFVYAVCYAWGFGKVADDLTALLTMLWFFAFVFTLYFLARRNFVASLLIVLWTVFLPAVIAISGVAFPLLIFDWCILVAVCLAPIFWFIYLQFAPDPE